MYCENCGAKISKNANFCGECGWKTPYFKSSGKLVDISADSTPNNSENDDNVSAYSRGQDCGRKIHYGNTLCRKCREKRCKRKLILRVVLAIVAILVVAMIAFATIRISNNNQEKTSLTSGNNGSNISWSVKKSTLTISCLGAMDNYSFEEERPWESDCKNIEKIVISEGVTSIGSYAFSNLTALKEISFPSTLNEIGDSAFEDCRSLQKIEIPQSVSILGSFAFSDCSSIEAVTIPGSICQIGDYAFSFCSGLKSVTITDGVREIGRGAFAYCQNMTDISIPKSVNYVDNYVFTSCNSLSKVVIPNKNASYFTMIAPDCDIKVKLGNEEGEAYVSDIKTIGNITWTYDNGTLTISGNGDMNDYTHESPPPWEDYKDTIEKVVVSDGVTSIGGRAFYHYESLSEVSISTDVKSIGYSAFGGCDSLKTLEIPSGVEYIETSAFLGCANLQTIVLPQSLKYLGSYSLSDCYSLTTITIPKGIKVIFESTFAGCTTLADVTLPDSIKVIETDAFFKCSNLASITIPHSVEGIARDAFADCYRLKNVNLENPSVNLGKNVFDQTPYDDPSVTPPPEEDETDHPTEDEHVIYINDSNDSEIIELETYIDSDPRPLMQDATYYVSEKLLYNFSGDISDVLPCFKGIDLDGDGLVDSIYRELDEQYNNYGVYSIVFGDGTTFDIDWDQDSPYTGHDMVFSISDINGDGVYEILVKSVISAVGCGGYSVRFARLIWKNRDSWTATPIPLISNINTSYNSATNTLRLVADNGQILEMNYYPISESGQPVSDFEYESTSAAIDVRFSNDCQGIVWLLDTGPYKNGMCLYGVKYLYDGNGNLNFESMSTEIAEDNWPDYYKLNGHMSRFSSDFSRVIEILDKS